MMNSEMKGAAEDDYDARCRPQQCCLLWSVLLHQAVFALDDKLYKKKGDVPLSPSRKEAWDKPGRPKAHYDYHKAMDLLTGKIPNEDERWQRKQDYYLNCISDCDRSVDTILTDLDNLGMLENTIVVLTADHGELCGAHGMSGKGANAYREQNNVPLLPTVSSDGPIMINEIPYSTRPRRMTATASALPFIIKIPGAGTCTAAFL